MWRIVHLSTHAHLSSCENLSASVSYTYSATKTHLIPKINVSPRFELHPAISQSARADEIHHSFECRFYPQFRFMSFGARKTFQTRVRRNTFIGFTSVGGAFSLCWRHLTGQFTQFLYVTSDNTDILTKYLARVQISHHHQHHTGNREADRGREDAVIGCKGEKTPSSEARERRRTFIRHRVTLSAHPNSSATKEVESGSH